MRPRMAFFASVVLTVCGLLAGQSARAQFAVIDVPALAQLVQEVAYWQQQIAAMQTQVDQLRQTYAALTGPRGLQNLLALTVAQRNYLPPEAANVATLLGQPGAGVTDYAAPITAYVRAHAILEDARLQDFNAGDRATLLGSRQRVAAIAVLAQSAYQRASDRFAQLQQLIAAVGDTPDAKQSADLNARIAAEGAMLANEQAKLGTLYSLAQTQAWAGEQTLREQVIAGHGQFAHRFEPAP